MRCFIIFTLSLFVFSFVSCTAPSSVASNEDVLNAVSKVKEHFVPDNRIARFDITATEEAGNWILKGETNLQSAKDSLLLLLKSKGVVLKDEIEVWPAKELGERTFGLTRHSVANLRSEKGHSQELATQLLLGTPLSILKKDKEWYFVQCPDGYLAWIHGGEVSLKTDTEMNQWKDADRVVFIGDYEYSFRGKNQKNRIGDLVKGGILLRLEAEENITKIAYPDGREAYVESNYLQTFDDYLDEHQLSFSNTLLIARKQTGKPYLWGGTSPKAMDCSGFTKTLYWEQGLIIPRDASQQVNAGIAVEYDESLNGLEEGDFLFFGRFREDGSEKITHVGLYIGEGRFIHSGSDNGANKEQSLIPNTPDFAPHRKETLLRARRMNIGTNEIVAVKDHKWYW